jgi:hypothetical protein
MIREVWPSAASSTSARSTTPGTPSASSAFWEVVAVYRSFNDVRRTADWLDQPANAVESALRYYEAHRVEVDTSGSDGTRRQLTRLSVSHVREGTRLEPRILRYHLIA